jgi:hypothetical protein
MRIQKQDIPVKLQAPGAVARQHPDFGEVTGYGRLAGEYFSLAAGTDIKPLLQGLEDDACHAPHWGYLISGTVVVAYSDGTEETCRGGDLFFWPPGHSVRVDDDAEVILFSPEVEHSAVMAHMGKALEAMA